MLCPPFSAIDPYKYSNILLLWKFWDTPLLTVLFIIYLHCWVHTFEFQDKWACDP